MYPDDPVDSRGRRCGRPTAHHLQFGGGERALPSIPCGLGDQDNGEAVGQRGLEVAFVRDIAQRHLHTFCSELGDGPGIRDERPDLTSRRHQPIDQRPSLLGVGSDHDHRHIPNLTCLSVNP